MAVNWTLDQVLQQLNSGMSWTSSTITYAFPTNGSGLFSQGEAAGFRPVSSTQQSIFVLAVQTWDDLIAQNFQQTTSTGSNIEFGFTTTNIAYAHTYLPTNGSAWFLTGSDVSTATIGSYGFSTIMHELGHALGLEHMGDYNGAGAWTPSSFQDSRVLSIMSYFGPSGGIRSNEVMTADWTAASGSAYSPQTPMLNDVLAIQQVYGASTTTRIGDTVYGFSSNISGTLANLYDFTLNQNPILTLFDSGGNDTLNLSGWSSPSLINLESGSYSSCNNMTNNIAIAYNCVIENVVGGGGDDFLRGNSAANRLDGGSGNDSLDGGAANDTLIGGAGNDLIIGGDGDDTAVFAGTFASYSISYNPANISYTISGASTGTDVIFGVELFKFSDVLRSAAQLLSTDLVAPSVLGFSPADNSTGVAASANLVLSMSEAVQAGSGNITVVNANGTAARAIAVGDASQVSISGSTVTINPATDLTPGASYYLNVAAGALKDTAGNIFAGISGTTTFNFSVAASADTTAPNLVNLSPAYNATGIAAGADLVFTFSEPVVAGSGNILIYNASGAIARSIAITDTSQVSISGNTVTVNPSTDLTAGSAYYVNVAAGAIKDLTGNSFAGIAGVTAFTLNVAVPAVSDDFPFSTSTQGVVNVNGVGIGGVIESAYDGDLFKVSLTAGLTYVFDAARQSGGLTDPHLFLYRPTGDLLTQDDESGGSGNARITFTPTSSGTYYLGVFDHDIGTGAYTVSAKSTSTSTSTPNTGLNLRGTSANESFTGGPGNDTIDGGAGIDTTIFTGNRISYSIIPQPSGFLVRANSGTDGTDTLNNVERLKFSDFSVALDVSGSAGTTAKILGAVFGKAAVANKEYAGTGLQLLDGGMSYLDLMQLALNAKLGAGASYATVVTLLYTNVVGTPPPAADLAFYQGLLDSGAHTRASLGVLAADTVLNIVNINLVGLANSGLEYLPQG